MSKKNIINLVVGPVATNCWIYPFGSNSAAIIDPGDEADAIITALKKANLVPEYILLTHGHFDHILAIPKLTAFFNPKPQIVIHHHDSPFLGPESYENHCISVKIAMGTGEAGRSIIDLLPRGMPAPDVFIDEGSEIGPFTVLHTPGHTPGSVSFFDKEAKILFTGDTFFKDGFGRTDIPGGNAKQIYFSVKRLLALDPDIVVYPGHGETTTIGKEAK